MAPKHYENMKEALLSELLTAELARLVPSSLRTLSGGYTEIPLEVRLRPETAEKLSYRIPWDGTLYGFVRGKEALRMRLGLPVPPESVTLSDRKGRFTLIFETEPAESTAAFSVSEAEVLALLEQCRRPADLTE